MFLHINLGCAKKILQGTSGISFALLETRAERYKRRAHSNIAKVNDKNSITDQISLFLNNWPLISKD